MTEWQNELFDENAYHRLIDAAGLPYAKIQLASCHRAINWLANRAVHQSFDATLETRTADRVLRWATRKKRLVAHRLEGAIVKARPFGGYQVPPATFRNGHALKEWVSFEQRRRSSSPPKAGRPDAPFADELFECLLKSFYEIYREDPYKYKLEAAKFLAHFFLEIDAAFVRIKISDPERRGRTPKWKAPTEHWLQIKIAQYPLTSAHLDWRLTDEGQFFRSDVWLKRHAKELREFDKVLKSKLLAD